MKSKKVVFFIWLILLISLCMSASAQVYSHGGLQVSVPDEATVTVSEEYGITFRLPGINIVNIQSVSFEELDIDLSYIRKYGTKEYIQAVTTQIEGCELRKLGGYDCAVVHVTKKNERNIISHEMEIATIIGEAFVSVIYYGPEADPYALMNEVMSWISEADENSDAYTQSPAVQKMRRDDEYELANGKIRVTLSEDKFNLFTKNNPEDSRSLQRMGYTKGQMDGLVTASNRELLIVPIGGSLADSVMSIRIKKKDYLKGYHNLADCPRSEVEEIFRELVYSFWTYDYKVVSKDNVVYVVFEWEPEEGTYERRYATLYDESWVYIWVSSKKGPLTDEHRVMLDEVVDAIIYQ